MPGSTSNSGIRDNHRRGLVADFLKAKIGNGSRLSVVSAYFTIYAHEALRDHLDRIDHMEFLVHSGVRTEFLHWFGLSPLDAVTGKPHARTRP